MPEVKPSGSSAQDAGKATEQVDLNGVSAEAQPTDADKQSQEIAKASDDTSQEAEESNEAEAEESTDSDGEAEQEELEEGEGTNEDGKAAYLQQKQEKNAARKIQEVSQKLTEAQKRLDAFEQTQERLVRSDVNYLYVLAQTDKDLADKMVNKVFGQSHGVETLEELKILADRNKADAQHKSLYDQQLATMKELRELRKEREARQVAETQTALTSFRAAHPEFKGDLQRKALEIKERAKGAFSLEESFEMAKGLVKNGASESSEKAAVKSMQNKAGTRSGGESKVGMGKGKLLTQSQVEMAKRFRNDPSKVY